MFEKDAVGLFGLAMVQLRKAKAGRRGTEREPAGPGSWRRCCASGGQDGGVHVCASVGELAGGSGPLAGGCSENRN